MRTFAAVLIGTFLVMAFGVTYLGSFDRTRHQTILAFTSIECSTPISAGQPALGGCPAGP